MRLRNDFAGPRQWRSFLLVILCFFLGEAFSQIVVPPSGEEGLYECQIEARASDNFDYAAVQLWAPPGVKKIRGILCIVLHPLDKGGSRLAYPEPWVRFAWQEKSALLVISFAQSDDLSRDWCRADRGTGHAFFQALDVLKERAGIVNLSTAPITILGVCAAGQFAYHLAAIAPDRVRAFVTIGGGRHDLSKIATAAHISGLIVIATDRSEEAIENLESLYLQGRAHQAPWLRDYETIQQYDKGFCSDRILAYIKSRLAFADDDGHRGMSQESTTGARKYLPWSVCGERLPVLGRSTPIKVDLGSVDTRYSNLLTCGFEIQSILGSRADDIFVAARSSAVRTSVDKISAGRWAITCQLDYANLPLGPLKFDVPIRFLQSSKQLLGGDTVSFTGFLTGDVGASPRSLNIGGVGAGKSKKISVFLTSNSSPITDLHVASMHNWIKVSFRKSTENRFELICNLDPPNDLVGKEFSGYLQASWRQSAGDRQMRIYYYGFVLDKL
jgi:hypothetical protein